MKILSEYLSTDIKNTKIKATNETIYDIVNSEIERLGDKANLNHIDTSQVTHMPGLFNASSDNHINRYDNSGNLIHKSELDTGIYKYQYIDVDISNWDVSNVVNMCCMFYFCKSFNCNISKWDVSKLVNANYMFYECRKFDQNLSSWDFKYKEYNKIFINCLIQDKFKPKGLDNKKM